MLQLLHDVDGGLQRIDAEIGRQFGQSLIEDRFVYIQHPHALIHPFTDVLEELSVLLLFARSRRRVGFILLLWLIPTDPWPDHFGFQLWVAVDDSVDLPDEWREHIIRDCPALIDRDPILLDRPDDRRIVRCAFDDLDDISHAPSIKTSCLFDSVLW